MVWLCLGDPWTLLAFVHVQQVRLGEGVYVPARPDEARSRLVAANRGVGR